MFAVVVVVVVLWVEGVTVLDDVLLELDTETDCVEPVVVALTEGVLVVVVEALTTGVEVLPLLTVTVAVGLLAPVLTETDVEGLDEVFELLTVTV